MVDVEAGLGHLGHPGCFHIIVFICLGLNNLVVVMNHLAMVVYAPKTPHKCHMSDDWLNATTADGSVVTPGQCSVFVNRSVSGNVSEHQACQARWDYEVQAGAQNIIMQVYYISLFYTLEITVKRENIGEDLFGKISKLRNMRQN